MRFAFLIIVALLVGGAHYYILYRLWHLIPFPAIRPFLAGAVACLFAILFAVLLLRDVAPLWLTAFTHRAGLSWLMIFLYALILFLALDLLRLFPFIPVKRILTANWVAMTVIFASLTLTFIYGYINYLNKKRTELRLEISKPMQHKTGLTIVAVSDLHLGDGIGTDELEGWVKLINAEQPDIVLIAGDVVDNNIRPLFKYDYAASLRKIKAPSGVYAVLGNHEYIGNLPKSLEFYRSTGITLLRDSSVSVNGDFYIIGRDDFSNKSRLPLSALTQNLDRSKPLILLDHQPHNLGEAEQNNIDLQISGHTHYGQVWPLSLITRKVFEKAYGYIRKGNTHVYVSSGLGIWGGKFRIGTRSEYVVIRMETTGEQVSQD